MPRLLESLARLTGRSRGFAAHRDGNVAIITAFALIPIVGLVGLGTDYGVALTDKSKLDNAADSAAIAAVASAKAYVAANPNDTNLSADAVAAGLNQASRSFIVNMGNLPFAAVPTPTTSSSTAPTTNTCGQTTTCIYLTQSGQTFTSTVYYRASTQNHFGQIFGNSTMNLAGTSVASAQIPSYIDFYLMIDVSGSMGLPSTSAGQTQLASLNYDNYNVYQQGCQFACHFPGYTGFSLAETNHIQLRSGAVNNAVCAFLTRTASPYVANEYRVGIYPFITMMTNQFSPLSGNYSNLNAAMGCSLYPNGQPLALDNLLDTGTSQFITPGDKKYTTGTGSGGTNLGPSSSDSNSIFTQMKTEIASYTASGSTKDGTSQINSKPFVFLITDGMENPQHYASNRSLPYQYISGSFDGLRAPIAITPSNCDALKNAGVTISILYIPYVNLIYKQDPYTENAAANSAIPNLATNLQQCSGSKNSSDNFFYTANSPADITASLNSMFNQAVQVAHLKQ